MKGLRRYPGDIGCSQFSATPQGALDHDSKDLSRCRWVHPDIQGLSLLPHMSIRISLPPEPKFEEARAATKPEAGQPR